MKFIVWLFAYAVAVAPPRPTTPIATEVDKATAPRKTASLCSTWLAPFLGSMSCSGLSASGWVRLALLGLAILFCVRPVLRV